MLWQKEPSPKSKLKKALKLPACLLAAAGILWLLLFGVRKLRALFTVPDLPVIEDSSQGGEGEADDADSSGPDSTAGTDAEEPEEEPEPVYRHILLVGLDSRNQSQLNRANSDTMIIARLEENSGKIRLVSIYRDTLMNIGVNERQEDSVDDDGIPVGRYDKCNAAYANGGIDQLITMIGRNLDIAIDGYVVVNFTSLAKAIDGLGGLDIWMTKQEVIHMNNYCVETSAATGISYEPIEPEEEARSYHLSGVQAVSYARIRYTAGNDMKRTQRQRVVVERVVEKAQEHRIRALGTVLVDLLPYTKMSFSFSEIIRYVNEVNDYEIESSTGFPFTHLEKHLYSNNKNLDPVVPVTLASNVSALHNFLYDTRHYVPSRTVQTYSAKIAELSGLDEEYLDDARKNSVIRDSGGEADVVK